MCIDRAQGNSRNLGDQLDDVLVIDKEVAESMPEAKDEAGGDALKSCAQSDADAACKQ
jgi:hypothetical protein